VSASKRPAPPQVAGPAEVAAKTFSAANTTANSRRQATVAHLPLSYSQRLLENADAPVPEYGSTEWQQLPDGSRAKVAAIVVAAEKWRTGRSGDGLPVRWTDNRHRRIEDARRPRPGDHPGGPVPWEREVAASE